MLTLLTFIIVLGILIFVHEAGHFIVAKRSGMAVEEFGFGFPPRLVGIQKVGGRWRIVRGNALTPRRNLVDSDAGGQASSSPSQRSRIHKQQQLLAGARDEAGEAMSPRVHEQDRRTMGEKQAQTIYSLNWLPLGGFVRIRGEDGGDAHDPRSFAGQPRWRRALVLVAGVVMNFLLAVALFTSVYAVGARQVIDDLPPSASIREQQITILGVLEGSAAAAAGFQAGDAITAMDGDAYDSPDALRDAIAARVGQPAVFTVERNDASQFITATPGPLPGSDQQGLGVQLVETGIVAYPMHRALWEGLRTTGYVSVEIARALGRLVIGLVTERAVTVDLAGPVGIAVMTGQAAELGILHLLQFMAVLSANLAFVNILPFPALDGGRLLFLAIEAIRRRALAKKIEYGINAIGFAVLIGLVILVTVKDLSIFGGGILESLKGAVGM